MNSEIESVPFSWNDNLSEEALEDFQQIQKDLPYLTCQSIGMALAKLEILEKLLEAEPIKAIPLDKVKKVREEIDDLDRYFDNDLYTNNTDSMFKCSEVLEILDKLIESENS